MNLSSYRPKGIESVGVPSVVVTNSAVEVYVVLAVSAVIGAVDAVEVIPSPPFFP